MACRKCAECGQSVGAGTEIIELGHLKVDGAERTVTWKGRPIKVGGPVRFAIIELMASRPGREVRRDAFFMLNIIGDDAELHTVDVHICKIRKAFKAVDPEFDQIKTVWGTGWRWASS